MRILGFFILLLISCAEKQIELNNPVFDKTNWIHQIHTDPYQKINCHSYIYVGKIADLTNYEIIILEPNGTIIKQKTNEEHIKYNEDSMGFCELEKGIYKFGVTPLGTDDYNYLFEIIKE